MARFARAILDSATKRLKAAEQKYDSDEERRRALARELTSCLRPFLTEQASELTHFAGKSDEQFLQLARLILRAGNDVSELTSNEHDETRDALSELKDVVEARLPRQAAAPPTTPRFEGPKGDPATAVPHFCGDRELDDCQKLLQQQQAVLVVQGMGGIGKTALAREFVARHGSTDFPDGCYWLDASSLATDLPRLAARLGMNLGREPLIDEARDWVVQTLTARRALLILDNVTTNGTVLSQLPIPGGSSKVLLTTRDLTVGLQLGQTHARMDLEAWTKDRARSFLKAAQSGFHGETDEALDALTALVGGLPLALQLLARYPFLDREADAARILGVVQATPLTTFERLDGLADVHTGGLAQALQSTLLQLELVDRVTITVLASCADGVPSEVVAAIAQIPAADATASLNRLANASLATYATPPAPWSLHDVVRMLILATSEGQEVAAAHDRWVFAECTRLQAPEAYRELDLLVPDATVAIERLLKFRLLQDASTLFERLYDHLIRRGAYALILELGEQLIQQLPPASGHLAARLGNVGNCYGTIGDFQQAYEHHDRALKVFVQLGDVAAQATQLSNLGVCLVQMGKLHDGKDKYEAALKLARGAGNVEAEANSLGNLGNCLLQLGNPQEAITHLEAALALNVAQARADLQANQHNNLGNCFVHLGNLADASRHYQAALALNEQIGHIAGQLDSRSSLARCYSLLGDHDRAIKEMEAVLLLHDSIDRPQARATALLNTGHAYRAAQRPEDAKKYFKLAYEAFDNLDDLANALNSLGTTEMRLGNLDKAISLHEEAAAIAHEIGNRADEAICLEHLGRCHLFGGRLARAIELLEQACMLSSTHGSAEAVMKQNTTLASMYILAGRKEEAAELLAGMLKKNQQEGFEMPEVTATILMLLSICDNMDRSAEGGAPRDAEADESSNGSADD